MVGVARGGVVGGGAAKAEAGRRGCRSWHGGGESAGLGEEEGARVAGTRARSRKKTAGPGLSRAGGGGRRSGHGGATCRVVDGGGGRWRTRPAGGGHVRRRGSGGDDFFLGFRGEGEIRKRRGVYIGIEGARRVQMRCGFRPHDRDRTL